MGLLNARPLNWGLLGFVCNRLDGSVYVEVEGPEGKLLELVGWCRNGPELAKVEKVEVSEGELKNFKTFEIRR